MTKKNDRRHQDNLKPEQRSETGRMGGLAISRNRQYMREIGRKGGKNSRNKRKKK